VTAPLIIAHRTCPLDAPENSLAGIGVAAEQGADGVEIDLRMSLDQQPFMMHDWTMRRTTGFPLPLELTPSAFVRKQRLQHTDEHVHNLADAFNVLPENLMLAVDVKTPWAIVPLMREIKRRGLESRVFVWCESALAVRYATWTAPQVEVAYLKTALDPRGKREFIWRARRLGARAISAHWLAIEPNFVAMAHDYGLRVYSYHEAYDLALPKLQAGLDGLITDYPVAARAAFAKAGGPVTAAP
jgi:glycerophosphoryl diester phosphodiesterase